MKKSLSKEKPVLTIALAGNPNCGKTTLFNALTGEHCYVGNWPGVTVEQRIGTYYLNDKKKGDFLHIVDLPGIYSLAPYSPEEIVSRQYLIDDHPDLVIDVIDGTNLERNLFLTSELLEIDVPLIVAVNMMDAVELEGRTIDLKLLSKRLGVPVVPVSALKEHGLDDLVKLVLKEGKKKRLGQTLLAPLGKKEADTFAAHKVVHPLFHALKVLEGDILEKGDHFEVFEMAQDQADQFPLDIATMRNAKIHEIAMEVVKDTPSQEEPKVDKIDRVLTHKIFGPILLVLILFAIFNLVFATDFLYLHAMGLKLQDYPGFLSWTMLDGEVVHPFQGLFYDASGIVSPGEFLHRLIGDNATGILGCASLGFKQLLLLWNAPEWVVSMFYDGILNGVCAVLGFLPQILLLFAFFSFLEDSGYMARIALLLDRALRRFGVSGKAFLPMIMGFGCGVPAMINTRTLSSEKERVKTIRVIPFFTCGAKAEFLVAIAAVIASSASLDPGLFTFGLYAFGVIVALLSVIVMSKTTQKEKVPPFIMELPNYRRPKMKALAIHVYDKAKHFVQKAFTIIFASTVIVWLFTNFTWDWTFIPTTDPILGLTASDSILANLSMLIQPLFTPLGFGYNTEGLKENGWAFITATLQGIVAKENVAGGLESLSGVILGSGSGLGDLVASTGISTAGLAAFSVFNLFTIPCFASVSAARSEIARKRDFIGTILFWLLTSYVLGMVTYLTFAYVWTLAIWLPLLALLLFFIFNKKKAKVA